MAASDLHDLCLEWLEVCKEAVASTGEPIDRAFVTAADPAFDCFPQLTVHTFGTAEAPTSPSGPVASGQRVHLFTMNLVSLFATVVRCFPALEDDGEIPTAEEQEAATAQTNADLWAILNFTRGRIREGSLFPSPSGKRDVFLDDQLPIRVEGGGAGWVVPIRVSLGGYPISS